ncbi:hypothetical protein GQR58_022987 [Nymphon striatum]|nr:hypothetical protein GQR58_022987 [Nymphon striatum]
MFLTVSCNRKDRDLTKRFFVRTDMLCPFQMFRSGCNAHTESHVDAYGHVNTFNMETCLKVRPHRYSADPTIPNKMSDSEEAVITHTIILRSSLDHQRILIEDSDCCTKETPAKGLSLFAISYIPFAAISPSSFCDIWHPRQSWNSSNASLESASELSTETSTRATLNSFGIDAVEACVPSPCISLLAGVLVANDILVCLAKSQVDYDYI